MNNAAEYCGQRNDRAVKNILPAVDGGLDPSHATGRERDTVPLHRGRPRVEGKNGIAAEANSGAMKFGGSGDGAGGSAADLAQIPEGVRASVAPRAGEYDARRLRSQREIIRDVMISAADCETWLTLGELRALTRYGEASISAQLRHLRKMENGGYDVVKRHREGASPERPGTDGRGECVWEYRITRGMCGLDAGGTNSCGLHAAA